MAASSRSGRGVFGRRCVGLATLAALVVAASACVTAPVPAPVAASPSTGLSHGALELPSPSPAELIALHDRTGVSDDPAELENRHKGLSPGPSKARFSQPLVPRDATRAVVLLYHSIDHGLTPRSVWPWDLEAQIVRLRDNQTEIIKMSQLVAFLSGDIERLPARVAVITIDDGEALLHKYAWPVLKKQRAPFTIGVITQPTEMAGYAPALSWQQLGEMVASGLCEIASHGHTHAGLTARDTNIDFELRHSRELIEQHLGISPLAFMYPLGAWDEAIAARVKAAGYRAAFGVAGEPVSSRTPRYAIPRFEIRQRTSLAAMSVFFEGGPPPR